MDKKNLKLLFKCNTIFWTMFVMHKWLVTRKVVFPNGSGLVVPTWKWIVFFLFKRMIKLPQPWNYLSTSILPVEMVSYSRSVKKYGEWGIRRLHSPWRITGLVGWWKYRITPCLYKMWYNPYHHYLEVAVGSV